MYSVHSVSYPKGGTSGPSVPHQIHASLRVFMVDFTGPFARIPRGRATNFERASQNLQNFSLVASAARHVRERERHWEAQSLSRVASVVRFSVPCLHRDVEAVLGRLLLSIKTPSRGTARALRAHSNTAGSRVWYYCVWNLVHVFGVAP